MPHIIGQQLRPEQTGSTAKLPGRLKANTLWWYKVRPERIQFISTDDGGAFAYLPGKIKFDPGVGGMKAGNANTAIANATGKGWILIPPDDHRLGPYSNYIQRFPKQGRGSIHRTVFESVKVIGRQVFWGEGGKKANPDSPRPEITYYGFLGHIVSAGIAPAIDRDIKLALIIKWNEEVEQRASRLGTTGPDRRDHVSRGYKKAIARLRAMVAAFEREEGEPCPLDLALDAVEPPAPEVAPAPAAVSIPASLTAKLERLAELEKAEAKRATARKASARAAAKRKAAKAEARA